MTEIGNAEAARKRRHRNERIVATVVVLAIGAVAAAIAQWNARLGDELGIDRRYIPKQVEITPEVLLLRDYVRIDTSTPEGAAAGARWIAAWLQRNGVGAELIESAAGRLNVYARIRGRKPGEGLLLFNHIDVVGPGDGAWTVPPFEGRIVGDTLHGRGTLDMKALAVAQMLAFAEVARSGHPPQHDLVFLATADEETGSTYGMQWLIANRADVLQNVKYGITEGGITEMLSEKMTYFGIEIGGKQLVNLTLGADRIEALQALRVALEPHIASREPDRILPGVRTYFRDIAPTRVAMRDLLADIDRTIRNGEFWKLSAPYRDLAQNSLWVGAPQRSADGWSMRVMMMNLPDELPDARIAWLTAIAEAHGVPIAAVHGKQGPVPLSPTDTPLFGLVANEARARYGVEAGSQVLYRSTTDARFLRPLGIICYGLSPYPVDFFHSQTIHRTDERIRIQDFQQGVAFLRNVVAQWARQT